MEALAILAAVLGIPAVMIHNRILKRKHRVEHLYNTVRMLAQKRLNIVPEMTAVIREHLGGNETLIAEIQTVEQMLQNQPAASDAVVNEIGKAANMTMQAIDGNTALKNNERILHLQRTIFETEERVVAAVRAYNAAVSDFNNSISGFPSSSVANTMGIRPYAYLTHADHEYLARGDAVL